MAASTGPTPPSPHSSHPASTDQYSLPSSVCGSSIAESEDKDTPMNSAEDITPECILEIRYNSRLNLVAVDVRNGQTTRGLLRCTELCGIKVRAYEPLPRHCATGVIKDVDTTLTDEEITNNLRSPENRVKVRQLRSLSADLHCQASSTLVLFGIQLLHSKRNLSNAASAAAMDTVRPPASTVLCASAAVKRTRTETPALLKRGTPDQGRTQFKQSKSTRGSENYRERAHRSKTAQNYKTEDSVRFNRHSSKQGGRKLHTLIQQHNLTLLTDPSTPTRLGTSVARDTCPDLTMYRGTKPCTWQNLEEQLGSDHSILETRIHSKDFTGEARHIRITDWPAFRASSSSYTSSDTLTDWVQTLQTRLNRHTRTLTTSPDAPDIDSHLLHLWEARRSLTKRWRRQRHNKKLKRPTVCLERLGVTNTLEELIEAHRAAQLTRLRCTAQGWALLATLGFPPCPASLAAEGLSPAARARLTVAPIPRHMNPTRHSARRDHRSRYLRRAYPVGCDTVRALFTDASPQGVRGGITVVVDSDLRTVHAATERGLTDVSILEERAVARAILSTSFLSSSIPIHILTDSQTACRHFLYNTLHPSTASLLDPFLSSTSHNFRLVWVPGHAAVPGNERAHALARDLSHRAPGEDFVSIQPAPYSYSTHLAELRLARQHYPPPHPSLTRRDAVLWRQLQTNTFPTPLFYSYLHPSLSPPQCPHCGDRPNLFHMVWQCQLIPAVPSNPNPTPTSWEERLTDDTATGQQSLVDRAKAVAATYGAPD
ncbi:hypothetical protein HPB47_023759 [Ixodes persulcatus]|uniref:Uncharacterized protein n=1 Tax=Ixodes persulcatus TaxID=34615 RepID=A0AC60Q979_IXOPE|nr:hypothetical protein HPB47_023759 [Ixodes persulcatus]